MPQLSLARLLDDNTMSVPDQLISIIQVLDCLVDRSEVNQLSHVSSIISDARENLVFWIGSGKHYSAVSQRLMYLATSA